MMKAGTKIPGNYCQKPFIALTDSMVNVLSVLAAYTCCLFVIKPTWRCVISIDVYYNRLKT